MATVTSQTTVVIADASAIVTTVDFTIQPIILGSLALRQMVYPDATVLAPFTYEQNPSTWTNFDIQPQVKRPVVASLRTLTDTKLTGWQGYAKDVSITETWRGSDTEASMSVNFFRLLYNYFENPPTSGFIQWQPQDRTTNSYNILIERLTAGGTDITYNFIAARQDCILGDVALTFRIVSEV